MLINLIEMRLLISFLLIFLCSFGNSLALKRTKRYLPLVFRDSAAITFICGFGVPVHNLNPELVTVGMVFKSPQILPPTFQALRQPTTHNINSREFRENRTKLDDDLSGQRVFFYKALEALSKSTRGGHNCVLKMICDMASAPFHPNNGVFGEILHILLTPSSSLDYYGTAETRNYLKAEYAGRSGQQCHKIFPSCQETILERISQFI